MRFIIIILLFMVPLSALAQNKEQLIVCKNNKLKVLEVILEDNLCEASVHCFYGESIKDLKPCAPNNGWGLSPGTGSAHSLSHQTLHWTEASSHLTGKFAVSLGPTKIRAAASFGEGLPSFDEVEENTFWNVAIDRVDGTGTIRTRDGEIEISCALVERKF